MKTISIIGTGRVGLPLALMLCESGFKVYGIDTNKKLIRILNSGRFPFMEEGAQKLLRKHLKKNFFPTTNYNFVSESDAVIITVGTPINKNKKPDFTALYNSINKIVQLMKKKQLLILRSTIAPGTTERIKEIIERKKGIKEGKDFFIAHCPERVLEGKSLQELKELPQIIGVFNNKAFELSKEVFKFAPSFLKTKPRAAELAKLFANMYRYINFAIPNEFMKISNAFGVEFHEVRNLVNSGYKRGGLKLPGFTAGPCLQKDGFFLMTKETKPKLILSAYEVNEGLPEYLIRKVKKESKFNFKNKKVVILGMAFKADIDDMRNSLSLKLKKLLEREKARVYCHDPYIKEYNHNLKNILKNADIVFIAQPHKQYKKLTIRKLKELAGKKVIVCDVWGVLR